MYTCGPLRPSGLGGHWMQGGALARHLMVQYPQPSRLQFSVRVWMSVPIVLAASLARAAPTSTHEQKIANMAVGDGGQSNAGRGTPCQPCGVRDDHVLCNPSQGTWPPHRLGASSMKHSRCRILGFASLGTLASRASRRLLRRAGAARIASVATTRMRSHASGRA